jgi:hypothetical protein
MKVVMATMRDEERVCLIFGATGLNDLGKICLPNGMVIVGDWNGMKVSNASMHQGSFEDVPK